MRAYFHFKMEYILALKYHHIVCYYFSFISTSIWYMLPSHLTVIARVFFML